MAKTITAKANQSMLNVVLEATGTLDGALDFCVANDVSITDNPVPGTVYTVPDGIATDAAVLKYFKDNNIVPGNANLGICGLPTIEAGSASYDQLTVVVSAGSGAVALQWAKTSSLDSEPSGTITDVAASTTEITVTGLNSLTGYKIWLRTKCWGNFSARVNVTMETTAPPALLDATVILYPMQKVQVGYSAPNYYAFLQKKNAQFIATKGLQSLFLTTNKMYLIDKAFYISSGTGSSSYISSPLTSMTTGGAIYYKSAIPSPGEERMYWCEPLEPILTHTYKDIDDNEAVIMPVVFVNDAYDTAEILYPEITVTVLEQTETDVTVRLTRSHAAVGWSNVNLKEMQWVDDAISGMADPDDPLNPDKIIMVLSAGVTKVGVVGAYETDDTLVLYPSSKIQMVIEVA